MILLLISANRPNGLKQGLGQIFSDLQNWIDDIPNPIRAWFAIGLLSLIWGSSFIMLKYALEVFSPPQAAAGRMFFATLTLLPIALREVKNIPRSKWPALIIFAIATNIFTTLFYAIAQSELDSALNGILNTLTPLMTLIVGILFYKQGIKWVQGLGLIIGLIGTLLLLQASGQGEIGAVNVFVIFTIAATVLNGFMANMLKFNLNGLSAIQIASVAFLIIFPLAFGYCLYSGFFPVAVADNAGLKALGFIILLGVFANAFALILLSYAIQISSPVFGSLTTYLIPLVALFWGIRDGEIVGWPEIGAMALILASVYVVNRDSE